METAKRLLLLLLLASCVSLDKGNRSGRRSVAFQNDAIAGYWVDLPEGHSPDRLYPMIIVFHGAMGRAETAMERWSVASEEFILICPQGTARMGWQLGTGQLPDIMACIDDALERFGADPEGVFLTGHSMGGHVSWNLASAHPERFAGVAPTAAAPVNSNDFDRLLGVPLYVVHGRQDPIVDLARNQRAEQAINGRGGALTLVIVEGAGHGFVEDQRNAILEFFRRQQVHPGSPRCCKLASRQTAPGSLRRHVSALKAVKAVCGQTAPPVTSSDSPEHRSESAHSGLIRSDSRSKLATSG